MKRKKDWAKIKQQDNWKIGREEMIMTESDNNPTLVGIILFFLYLISYFLSNMRDNTIKIIYPIRNDSHRQNGCWHYGRRKHYPPTWGIVQLSLLLGENNLRKFEFHIIFFFIKKLYGFPWRLSPCENFRSDGCAQQLRPVPWPLRWCTRDFRTRCVTIWPAADQTSGVYSTTDRRRSSPASRGH